MACLLLKSPEGRLKLFTGVLAHLCKKEHHKNIAILNSLIVLVLQAGLRHGIQKVLPYDELKKYIFINPIFVLAIDKNFANP